MSDSSTQPSAHLAEGGPETDPVTGVWRAPITRRRFVSGAAALGAAAATTGTWLSLVGTAGAIDTAGVAPYAVGGVRSGGITRVFARRSDGGAWYRNTDPVSGAWGPWIPLGGLNAVTSALSAVASAGDWTSVFARTGVRDVWQATLPREAMFSTLDGACTSGPAVAVDKSGTTHVFVRATGNSLWTRRKPSVGNWTAWEPLGGFCTSGPAAATSGPSDPDRYVYVFVLGVGGTIFYRRWDANSATWGPWTSRGGVGVGGVTAATAPNGKLVVAVRGTDNQLWIQRLDTAGGAFTGWGPLGGVCTSMPSAAMDPTSVGGDGGGIVVFVRGGGNALHLQRFKQNTNSWSGFIGLGGVCTSGPTAVGGDIGGILSGWFVVVQGPNNALFYNAGAGTGPAIGFRAFSASPFNSTPAFLLRDDALTVYMRGGDMKLWHGQLAGAGNPNGPWRNLEETPGGEVRSNAPAVGDGNTIVDVFAVGSDNSVYTNRSTSGSPGGWVSMGGSATSSPAVVRVGNDLHAFVRGPANRMFRNLNPNGGGWGSWAEIETTTFNSEPAAVYDGTVIHLFARSGSALLTNRFTPPSGDPGSWTSLEGIVTSDPVAVKSGSQTHVIVRSSDNALYRRRWNGTTWAGYENLGGIATSSPFLVPIDPNGSGAYDLYVRGISNVLYRRHWNGTAWGGWQSLGGTILALHGS